MGMMRVWGRWLQNLELQSHLTTNKPENSLHHGFSVWFGIYRYAKMCHVTGSISPHTYGQASNCNAFCDLENTPECLWLLCDSLWASRHRGTILVAWSSQKNQTDQRTWRAGTSASGIDSEEAVESRCSFTKKSHVAQETQTNTAILGLTTPNAGKLARSLWHHWEDAFAVYCTRRYNGLRPGKTSRNWTRGLSICLFHPKREPYAPKNRRFSTLVALMLSSQTKDEVTDVAVKKLRASVGGVLSIEAVIAAEESTISEAINKVGFWRRKTGWEKEAKLCMGHLPLFTSQSSYIKQAAKKLRDDFASDLPKTVDELCSLPGVGPKMAFLALQSAWNLCVIAVHSFSMNCFLILVIEIMALELMSTFTEFRIV